MVYLKYNRYIWCKDDLILFLNEILKIKKIIHKLGIILKYIKY
jgi:hypothetical protein